MKTRILILLLFSITVAVGQTVKIMPIGHSFVLGNWTGGHRPQIMKMLHDSGYTNWKFAGRLTTNHEDNDVLGFDFPDTMWGHEGYSGFTGLQISQLAGAAIAANPSGVFLLEIGTNDIASGSPYTNTQARDHIKYTLDTIYSRVPTAKIILSTICRAFPGPLMPDSGAFNTRARAVNAMLPALQATYTIQGKYLVLVDQYPTLTSSADVEDGVHPSYNAYIKMARVYYPHLRNALSSRWLTAYYGTWWYFANPPSKIPWNKITHLILFGSAIPSTTSPTKWSVVGLAPAANSDSANLVNGDYTGAPSNYLQRMVDSANIHGVKLLIGLGGEAPINTYFATICGNQTDCNTMVTSIVQFAQRKGLHGVSLDWEWPGTGEEAAVNRLLRTFRNIGGPSFIIEISGNYMKNLGPQCNNSPFGFNKDTIMAYVDQFNLQSYNMFIGTDCVPYTAGYDTPINRPNYPGYTGIALNSDSALPSWDRIGLPRSKIGIGMNYTPSRFIATRYGLSWSERVFTTVDGTGSSYQVQVPRSSGTWVWSDTAKAFYARSGQYLYNILDTTQAAYIGQYARDSGYGGVMVFDIGAGTYRGQSNLAVANQVTYTLYSTLNGLQSVVPPSSPVIQVSQSSLPAFTSITPNPSSAQGVTVTGSGLSGDILVSAFADYQVSVNEFSGFASSITLTQFGGSVSPTTIWIRMNRAIAGSPSGNISLTSPGALARTIAVSGTASNPVSPSTPYDLRKLLIPRIVAH